MNHVSAAEVKRTVEHIDEVRRSHVFRDPDRPDGQFVRPRRNRQPKAILQAQQRLRTDRWRSDMDRRRAPTASQIGMSLVVALVTSRLDELTPQDRGIVGAMLTDLQSRGFAVPEALATLRRMRNRLVDPADREGEPTESTGPAIVPGGEAMESGHPF